jgi:SAM-dependent MidA family methyltransferase
MARMEAARRGVTASLAERLVAEIAETGPISVADYMARCLHDPEDGYYATRPALGAEGDFITAPMVSQMFGELIGLWAVEVWRLMGSPDPFLLVELGPGDGTLMGDVLRAARLDAAFVRAMRLILVETSEPLIAKQRTRLATAATWVASVDEVPRDAPLILIANEFLDCLPARQFLRTDRGWTERRVGVDAKGALTWGLAAAVKPDALPEDAERDVIWEVSPAQAALGAELGRRAMAQGGCALLIDYGRDTPGPGDTLQALSKHQKVDPLADPGHADLTVWAGFPAALAAARAQGASTTAILPQGEFLQRLGLVARAHGLAHANPDKAETLERQVVRLCAPDGMGTLFKACAIHALSSAPGFEDEP